MADTPDPAAGEARPKPRQLGRGLSALFGDDRQDYAELDALRQSKAVAIELLHPNRNQPRRRFDEAEIAELAESLAAHGVLQPILVRRHHELPNQFEIIAGERRWRAAQQARLHEVPVVIRDVDDAGALELALIENVQRQNLNPLEEAEGYRRLIAEFNHSQEDLGRILGKSRSHIANLLRLLGLPQRLRDMLADGRLSAGHARALLAAAAPEALAERVIARGLNVRQTEDLVRAAARQSRVDAPAKDADAMALERRLSALLGLTVTLSPRAKGGQIAIRYQTLEQLDDVIRRLAQPPISRA